MRQKVQSKLLDLLVPFEIGTFGITNLVGELIAWDMDYFQAIHIIKEWENEL